MGDDQVMTDEKVAHMIYYLFGLMLFSLSASIRSLHTPVAPSGHYFSLLAT
jgi:hypothetical protein